MEDEKQDTEKRKQRRHTTPHYWISTILEAFIKSQREGDGWTGSRGERDGR